MDSVTQMALGAALSVAVMRRRQPLWQSALIGAAAGTLPDLDVLLQFDNPVHEMTRHRAESHGLLILTLLAWPLALLWQRLLAKNCTLARCYWALWAALFTHPLLDTLTIYGTQLLQPFSDEPYGTGSIFVIDPLYTVPLLLGLALCGKSLRWNDAMLALSSCYLLFGLWQQQQVRQLALPQLPPGSDSSTVLVTATPFNTAVWQILVLGEQHYHEAFYALADGPQPLIWRAWPRDPALLASWQHEPLVAELTRFSHGYVAMQQQGNQLHLMDLRMGLAPHYSFHFVFEKTADGRLGLPVKQDLPADRAPALRWLWQRASGQPTDAFFNPAPPPEPPPEQPPAASP